MIDMGHGYQGGKYSKKWFNKNRYIGVMGREAFHIFDLELLDFIIADTTQGYKTNIDKNVYHDEDNDDWSHDIHKVLPAFKYAI